MTPQELAEIVRESRRHRNAYIPPKKPTKEKAETGTVKRKTGGTKRAKPRKKGVDAQIGKLSNVQAERLLKMLKGQ